jgi:hypothetical protein
MNLLIAIIGEVYGDKAQQKDSQYYLSLAQ